MRWRGSALRGALRGVLQGDGFAVATLVLLWALFFWRVLTPVVADQQRFVAGDFDRQFYSFASYQYDRISQGEVPLWNPHNQAGLPFVADPQSAVFYPPRLLTIALASLTDSWSIRALTTEAISHVLLLSLLLYLFARRLFPVSRWAVAAAWLTAVVGSYNGFVTGYPLLQLALLEGLVWFPLAALGVLEATRHAVIRWHWLVLAGLALGLSWLAGHSQTSFLLSLLTVLWLMWRCRQARQSLRHTVTAIVVLAVVTAGATAVTLLPGVEYLAQSTRSGLSFDAKGNGFPYVDIWQMLLPYSTSLFAPLYFGVITLLLGMVAVLRQREARFWLAVGAVGLTLALGANSITYHAAYLSVPGLSFFRGQERFVMWLSFALSIAAGYGIVALGDWAEDRDRRTLRRLLMTSVFVLFIVATVSFVGRFVPESTVLEVSNRAAFALTGVAAASLLIWRMLAQRRIIWVMLLCALLVFDLLSASIDQPGVYAPTATAAPGDTIPPLTGLVLAQQADSAAAGAVFRVAGFTVQPSELDGNNASLYRLDDIHGISPLFLGNVERLVHRNYVQNALAWELLAVRFVWSQEERLSNVAANIVAQRQDGDVTTFLYQLQDPRPFALLIHDVVVIIGDTQAWGRLNQPDFNARRTLLLDAPIDAASDFGEPDPSQPPQAARIVLAEPERIVVTTDSEHDSVLSLALVYYPGWQATLDGQPVALLRANTVTSAIVVPAGEHRIELTYQPISFVAGGALSLLTWAGAVIVLLIGVLRSMLRRRRRNDTSPQAPSIQRDLTP